jgi:hypothetical protein
MTAPNSAIVWNVLTVLVLGGLARLGFHWFAMWYDQKPPQAQGLDLTVGLLFMGCLLVLPALAGGVSALRSPLWISVPVGAVTCVVFGLLGYVSSRGDLATLVLVGSVAGLVGGLLVRAVRFAAN